MNPTLPLDRARTAVLSMDFQNSIVSIYSGAEEQDLMGRASDVLRTARAAGVRVIHVQVGFRPGLPEISARNLLFGAVKASPQRRKLFEGPGGAIHPALAPEAGEVVVTKHRVGGFYGTDLEMILRAQEIDTLVLMGIATSGVVLSTLRHAADADYRLLVVRDCCADMDAEVHACMLDRVFPRQAAVVTSGELAGMLGA